MSLLESIAADERKPFVAVLFGNPYTAMALSKLPALLVTYEQFDAMEAAAARAIAGEIPIGGKLPVTMPGLFPFGHGVARTPAASVPPSTGLTPPKVAHEVRPAYTKAAKDAGIQGSVVLDVVIEPDGTVGEVTVKKSLDAVHGLDEEAVKAAKQWTFEPGTKDGKPVPVLVTLELAFTLRPK